jgi:hypothetical protein
VVKHWKSPSQNYSKKLDTIYLKVGNSFRFARVMSKTSVILGNHVIVQVDILSN